MIEPLRPKPDSKSHVVILGFDFESTTDPKLPALTNISSGATI